jgi:hypothetical protein
VLHWICVNVFKTGPYQLTHLGISQFVSWFDPSYIIVWLNWDEYKKLKISAMLLVEEEMHEHVVVFGFRDFLLNSFYASFGRDSVKRNPENQMLGRRQKHESKVQTSSSMYFDSTHSLLYSFKSPKYCFFLHVKFWMLYVNIELEFSGRTLFMAHI